MSNQPGFYLSVYRNAQHGDCSANGLSARHNQIFVISDGEYIREKGPFMEQDAIKNGVPVFEVGSKGDRFNLTPKGETRWTMFGGNFAYSSDSRCPAFPTAIHDRIEG